MMAQRTGLGRGLDALIPGKEAPAQAGVTQVPVDQIIPNPRQPRQVFNPTDLAELAESIRVHGIIQPLIVSRRDDGSGYVLIAGERRLMAARLAGLPVVPALVRAVDEQQRLELALIENVQRTDLDALEAAEAYRQLSDEFNLSHDEIAARVGKSRAAVTNTLRLLKLPADVQAALRAKRISEGHGRALLALPTAAAQSDALQTVLAQDLSVRQTEEFVRRRIGQQPVTPPRPTQAPEITAIEDRLRSALGAKVKLRRNGESGTVVIHFYSDEELSNLVAQIAGDH
jgi:ParB family transcriptional regulator, chromosome partitioning protein